MDGNLNSLEPAARMMIEGMVQRVVDQGYVEGLRDMIALLQGTSAMAQKCEVDFSTAWIDVAIEHAEMLIAKRMGGKS